MFDDVVVAFEYAVGEPVLAEELPDSFDWVQFGCFWWQRQQGDVGGYLQVARAMPACLVQNDDSVCVRGYMQGNLGKMGAHGVGIAPRQDQSRALALRRADRAEEVDGLGALILRCCGASAAPGPTPGDAVLLPNTGFILKPNLYPLAIGFSRLDRRQRGREAFLKASSASGFCPWWRGRAESLA